MEKIREIGEGDDKSGDVEKEMAEKEEVVEEEDYFLESVELSGYAAMKIIKQARENLPRIVTGQLLGLDVDNVLEVTNCFPLPIEDEDQAETDDKVVAAETGSNQYQSEMLKCLREVNVDYNVVGWYQSAFLGSFMNAKTIEAQFNYQKVIRKSTMLVYDPLKSQQEMGINLRAFRLSQSFMELKELGDGIEDVDMLPFNQVFEEIPIKVRNCATMNAMFHQLDGNPELCEGFTRLNLQINPFIEKTLSYLSQSVEKFGKSQGPFNSYQRRTSYNQQNRIKKGRNQEDDKQNWGADSQGTPPRLDSLLNANQIYDYCEDINAFAGQSFTKLFLLGKLQKSSNPGDIQF